MRYRIGILDSDFCYSESLMAFLNSSHYDIFAVVVFRNAYALNDYLNSNTLDMLLLDDANRNVSINCLTIRLVEDRNQCSEDMIFKYQSACVIAEELIERFKVQSRAVYNSGFLVGVYSPVGRCGKTELSHGLCYLRENSLYIGMEDNVSMDRYSAAGFSKDYMKGISQSFMYYCATENPEIIEILKNIPVINGYRALVITGGVSELRVLSIQNIAWLKNMIISESMFTRVIVDLGDGVLADRNILEVFDQVYFLKLEDKYSKGKIDFFVSEYADVIANLDSRLRYLNVPSADAYSEEMKSFIEMYAL